MSKINLPGTRYTKGSSPRTSCLLVAVKPHDILNGESGQLSALSTELETPLSVSRDSILAVPRLISSQSASSMYRK